MVPEHRERGWLKEAGPQVSRALTPAQRGLVALPLACVQSLGVSDTSTAWSGCVMWLLLLWAAAVVQLCVRTWASLQAHLHSWD